MTQDLQAKIDRAIKLLRDNEPKGGKGYGLAFSGGKDSCVIKQLAIEAGVKFKAAYSLTTMDQPPLLRFIREKHPDVEWLCNGHFFSLMKKKGMPPNFRMRYCCHELKEQSLNGFSAKIIGVRASESLRRAKRWREVVEDNQRAGAIIVCPIVYWTEQDVWNFIKVRNVPYCDLYDKGYKRLGCIACPMTSVKNIKRELAAYPKFDAALRKAFNDMWEQWHDKTMPAKGKYPERKHFSSRFKNGKEWYEHYINRGHPPLEETCQMELLFVGSNEERSGE